MAYLMWENASFRHFCSKIKSMVAQASVPVGSILMWSGKADQIPSGFALCDGQNGTPDLRGRFVLGSDSSHAIGSKGGSLTVQLKEANLPAHSHTYSAEEYSLGDNDLLQVNMTSSTRAVKSQLSVSDVTSTTGSGQAFSILPPYYTLCYIMKV